MASLISKASLLMVPSVYEDGTLYNVLPSGNKAPDETGNHNGYDQTRADFTFSRGSNLAATRVNADGLIEKGRENLLLQSNQFDTTWTNVSTTEASGFEGYDGTNDAWKLTKSASGGRIQQSTFSAGVYSFSVYVKANTNNWVQLYLDTTTPNDPNAFFDLQNGLVGTTSDNIDASIQSIGNGWYRCSVVGSVTTTFVAMIFPAEADNDKSGTTGSIYIQDAQLEYGLVSTPVIRTGATTATAGVLENTPRIDYSSGAGALLLESQRTNLITQSEYFGDSSWSYYPFGGASLTKTFGYTSPEGVNNAYKLDVVVGTGGVLFTHNFTATASVDHTLSVWMKGEVGGEKVQIDLKNTSSSGITGSLFTLTNQWKRYDLTITNDAGTSRGFQFRMQQSSGLSDQTIYVWGAQAEASASYPSSYVPTYGSAATRGADSCSVTGVSDVIGQTEGTIYGQLGDKPTESVYVFEMGQGSSQYRFFVYTDTSKKLKVLVVDNYAVQVSYTSSVNVEANAKIAVAYNTNDYAIYLNGSQLSTDTSASVPPMNQLAIGSDRSATTTLSVNLKQVALFNERLSNTELATLTTL